MCKFIFDATILISDNVDHAEKVPQKSRDSEEYIVLYLRHYEREILKISICAFCSHLSECKDNATNVWVPVRDCPSNFHSAQGLSTGPWPGLNDARYFDFHSAHFHSHNFHSDHVHSAHFHSAHFHSVHFHSVHFHSVRFHSAHFSLNPSSLSPFSLSPFFAQPIFTQPSLFLLSPFSFSPV